MITSTPRSTSAKKEIAKALEKYKSKVKTDMAGYVPTNKRIAKKNAVGFDMERYAYSLWGINAMQIPGVSLGAILVLSGELGHDFTEKFTTVKSFCKWCNLVPNNKISGGKLLSSHVPKHKNNVGQAFRQCANSVKDSKDEMGYYFRRIKSRNGHMQAIVATANKMARIFYTMVSTKSAYNPQKAGLDEKTLLERKIKRTQNALDKLNVRLRETGS